MDTSFDAELKSLLDERAQISEKITGLLMKKYKKYENMTEEVVNDNPYRYIYSATYSNSLLKSPYGSQAYGCR